MALVINNTNYSGEVLEQILTLAATGNEIVEKGLMCVIPGVHKAISIPRIKTGTMLRKRVEQPDEADAKGNFNYTERKLEPKDLMAFTTFNPRTFEHVWRPFQPKGALVFSELPPQVQNTLLSELVKQVKFELGGHFINGKYGAADDELFNGILTSAAANADNVVVTSTETTMLKRLAAVKAAIPTAIRNHTSLRIIMSVNDFDKYDDEMTALVAKGVDATDVTRMRYKGITIETLAQWPDDVIVATICSPGYDGNLFAAVNLSDEEEVIQIDKLTNAGERYFFKILMKADTNTAFGEEFVVLDARATPQFTAAAVSPTAAAVVPSGDGDND